MHNLHFVITRAESPQEACDNVGTMTSDFGNENNWRTICGCVSEKNKVFINDSSGSYTPKDIGYTTIAKINRVINKWIKSPYYGDAAAAAAAKKKLSRARKKIDLSTWNSSELFSLERLAKHLYEALPYKESKFDVLKDSFFSWQFDECGVTQDENENEGQLYVVFVDMHS